MRTLILRDRLAWILRRFLLVALIATATSAQAIPSIRDQWHFFCGPEKISPKLLQRSRTRAGAGGARGGIAQLTYACQLEIFETQLLQEKYQKWVDAGGNGAAPKLDNRGSTQALNQAVATLAAAYRAARTNPKVLYNYALALAVKGDVLTVNILDELMTGHKDHKLTKDSYLILADHYFERRDLEKAFREYGTALKVARPVVQAYARYKMLWINFALAIEQKNTGKQSKVIQELVSHKQRLERAKGKREKRLAAMIDSDVSELLAQQGNPNEARRILKSIHADDVYASVLERMGNMRLAGNDLDGAYQLYALSLREAPERKEALQIATSMAQIAAQKNNVKRLSDMLKYMVGNYTAGKTPWRTAQKDDAALSARASAQVEGLLIEYAAAIDNQGRQTSDQAMLSTARGLYELFIKSFKKSKKLREVKTQYATLLYLQKNYVKAAKTIHELLADNPKDKAAKDLSALMVTAAQYAVDADKTKYPAADPDTSRDTRSKSLPIVKQVFVDSLDMFAKLNPTDPNVPAMAFMVASVYYECGHFPEAVKRFDAYVAKYPANDFAKQASAKLLTYHLSASGSKKELARIVGVLTTNPTLGDAPEVQPLLAKAKEKLKSLDKKKQKKRKGQKADDEADDEDDEDDVSDGSLSGAANGNNGNNANADDGDATDDKPSKSKKKAKKTKRPDDAGKKKLVDDTESGDES